MVDSISTSGDGGGGGGWVRTVASYSFERKPAPTIDLCRRNYFEITPDLVCLLFVLTWSQFIHPANTQYSYTVSRTGPSPRIRPRTNRLRFKTDGDHSLSLNFTFVVYWFNPRSPPTPRRFNSCVLLFVVYREIVLPLKKSPKGTLGVRRVRVSRGSRGPKVLAGGGDSGHDPQGSGERNQEFNHEGPRNSEEQRGPSLPAGPRIHYLPVPCQPPPLVSYINILFTLPARVGPYLRATLPSTNQTFVLRRNYIN